MRLTPQNTVIWILAGIFALAAGVGEGWHLVPGSGHAVELPGGYLFIGADASHAGSHAHPRSPGFQPPHGNPTPCYGEDECSICRLCGQDQSMAQPVSFWLLFTVVDVAPAGSTHIRQASACWPFHIRAPPLG